MLRVGGRQFKVIEKCPKPQIDTGCTHCKVDLAQPIDQTTNLNGTKVNLWKHVLILSHKYRKIGELPSNINTEGIAQKLADLKHLRSPTHPVLASHIFLEGGYHETPKNPENELVYIYPDNIKVEFNRAHLRQFVTHYLVPKDSDGNPTMPETYNPFKSEITEKIEPKEVLNPDQMFEQQALTKPLILVCGHGTRDSRCGDMAPYLLNEINQIKNDEMVGTISHIGGHAYAGNVIFYPQNIWYGRVNPDKVQGIYHGIQNNMIIKELYRGPDPRSD